MLNNRFTFRVWTGTEIFYFKLGQNLPSNWSYWDTCMQNTNLKDKNGVEIYEGDIVKKNEEEWFEVVWLEDGAKFYHKRIKGNRNGDETWHIVLFNGEVIGNIYESPSFTGKDEN